jgi:hypothetical protein
MPPKGVGTPTAIKKTKSTVSGSGRGTSENIRKNEKVRRSSGIEREYTCAPDMEGVESDTLF